MAWQVVSCDLMCIHAILLCTCYVHAAYAHGVHVHAVLHMLFCIIVLFCICCYAHVVVPCVGIPVDTR